MSFIDSARSALDRAHGPNALFHLGHALGLCYAALRTGEHHSAIYPLVDEIQEKRRELDKC